LVLANKKLEESNFYLLCEGMLPTFFLVGYATPEKIFQEKFRNITKLITFTKKRNAMEIEVYVQATAFDKNSNDSMSRSIVAETKEDFNAQVEEFESSIPYTKYYTTLVSDDVLTPEQELIVSDYEVE
jgi:hypothetical protein